MRLLEVSGNDPDTFAIAQHAANRQHGPLGGGPGSDVGDHDPDGIEVEAINDLPPVSSLIPGSDQERVFAQLTKAVATDLQFEGSSNRTLRARAKTRPSKTYLLQAFAGTGKTHLLRVFQRWTHEKTGRAAIGCGATGCAAAGLYQPRTCHKLYRLALDLQEDPQKQTRFSPGSRSKVADDIRAAPALIVDESYMLRNYAWRGIDLALQHITGVAAPYGGKIMIIYLPLEY